MKKEYDFKNSKKNPYAKSLSFRKAIKADIPHLFAFIYDHGVNQWNYMPEDGVRSHLAEIETGTTVRSSRSFRPPTAFATGSHHTSISMRTTVWIRPCSLQAASHSILKRFENGVSPREQKRSSSIFAGD